MDPLAFITGASSGIGQALAGRYRRAGWRLALVARRTAQVEQWAQANSWKRVTADHIKGRQLCVEFNGKTLMRVRGEAL